MVMGRVCVMVVLMVLVAGCASQYPMGMSEDEWQALSAEQRLDARERAERLNLEAARQRAEQQRLRAEQERLAEQALIQRRREAQFGERVQCVLDAAELRSGGNWRDARPLGLDLIVGETHEFELLRKDSRHRGVTGQASFDGQLIELCDRRGRNCAVIAGTSRDFQRGLHRQIEIDDALRGELRCDLAEPQPKPGRRVHQPVQ